MLWFLLRRLKETLLKALEWASYVIFILTVSTAYASFIADIWTASPGAAMLLLFFSGFALLSFWRKLRVYRACRRFVDEHYGRRW